MNPKWLAVSWIAAGMPLLAAAEGITWNPESSPWPQFRARLGVGIGSPITGEASGRLQSMQLIGDYYFFEPNGPRGTAPTGLRASSGLLFGNPAGGMALPGRPAGTLSVSRSLASGGPDAFSSAAPYLGVGYSTTFAKQQWSVSADVGLVSRSLYGNAVRFGRPYVGSALDDAAHDPWLSPVIQFGVSYTF